MTTQTQTPEERLSKLEGVYEQVNERLRDLTQADATLRADMNERFQTNSRRAKLPLGEEMRRGDAALRAEMNERLREIRSEMHRQTYLIIGVIGGLVTLLRFIG